MSTPYKSLLEFHTAFNSYISNEPTFPADHIRELRKRLLKEEYEEFLDAEEKDDLVEVADALADMVYIIYGTAVSYGIPLDEVFDEVHRSNMSKLGPDGKPIFRRDGKVLKGPNYFRPNIQGILKTS